MYLCDISLKDTKLNADEQTTPIPLAGAVVPRNVLGGYGAVSVVGRLRGAASYGG